jgi:hypothetical protein
MRLATTDFDRDCLGIFEPGSLCSFADVKNTPEKFPAYAAIVAWIESVIVRPNAELGRAGPVCPRVRESIDRNLIKFSTVCTEECTTEEAVLKCEALTEAFYALFPNCNNRKISSLLVLFPNLERKEASRFIDGGHRRLRTTFVKNGLMLGEFHPQSTVPGAHNPAFRAMRAPFPLFAVRAISEHDHIFLMRPEFPIAERLECLKSLLAFVGDKLDSKTKAGIETAMANLQSESTSVQQSL